MPSTSNRQSRPSPPQRTARKGHYSCDFCRARKLRCSRPLPCINCVSRGKRCVLEEGGEVEVTPTAPHHEPRNLPTPAPSHSNDQSLIDEVHRLRRLAEDLERRISRSNAGSAALGDANHSPASIGWAQTTASAVPAAAPPDAMGPICAVVTHLDRMSMGKGTYADMASASTTGSPASFSSVTTVTAAASTAGPTSQNPDRSGLQIKIEPIYTIPTAPEYTFNIIDGDRLRAPRRCIYLPTYREMTVLLDTFLSTISSFYHIVHHPTVPDTVRRVYNSILGQQDGPHPPLGDVLLLLTIVATGTYLYIPPQGSNAADDQSVLVFSSHTEAADTAPFWIQAALHVLDVITRGPAPPSLSAVQGVITLSFLISNVEGIGFRYRYLVSTGLLLGRELGLHCIDQGPATSSLTTPFEREMGRRAWWYLASTDWLLAARNSGPGVGVYTTHPHMMRVNEPCNIDDENLTPSMQNPAVGKPLDTPTDMSYYLQRVRLARVARGIVDRMPMVSGTQFVGGGQSTAASTTVSARDLLATYRQAATESDADLEAMLHNLPVFLRLETYLNRDETINANTSSFFIQAFMLHSLIHTQRCKLHLSYLTSWRRQTETIGRHQPMMSQPSVSGPSTTSRAICIESARQIIHAETQLRRQASQHPFVQNRLSCVLYGVFLATIVLLIDLCAADNRDGDGEDDTAQKQDALAALQIVADARPHSPAASELYTSLTQLLAKHRPQLCEQGFLQGTMEIEPSSTTTAVARPPEEAMQPILSTAAGLESDSFGVHDTPMASFNDSLYGNPLALSFDGLDDLVNFQWDDLLAGVDTSMLL
ncbi:hypothetical protein SBRCBS47491_005621 [Sporothrix bragantina]|uniref:Zn(2)-C6 fungal-type domain-containing protein n=1 Tax=Sporothrix bragantina TaxID=671064 RepID=A0ABP0BYF7_9PEZI